MDVLEQEIIDRFQQLEATAKQRVLETLSRDLEESFDYASWWANVEAFQEKIRARLGSDVTVGALSLLDELREEES